MKEENKKREKYIKEKLSTTKIDKIFLPFITDIIFRRQEQFSLSDEHFKRDVDTFVRNVKSIEIRNLGNHVLGKFSTHGKKIIINSILLDNFDLESIFEVLCHECVHAMSMEKLKNGISKEDRTFNKKHYGLIKETAIMESFTQSQAEFMVQNVGGRHGYENITRYVNVISAAFGVKKNDLLKSAAEGRKELNIFLNNSISRIKNINLDNPVFSQISLNIEFLQTAVAKKAKKLNKNRSNTSTLDENIKNSHSKIYSAVEQLILKRINDLDISKFDEFKEGFEKIVINQNTIQGLMENAFSDLYESYEELRKTTSGKFDIVDTKLKCINEILNNPKIQNKQELISLIQSENELTKINEIINKNNLTVDFSKDIQFDLDTYKKHNAELLSDKKWNNYGMVLYFEKYKQEIFNSKTSAIDKFKNWIRENFKINKRIVLPEAHETRIEENGIESNSSWDLSNWGMNKDDLSQKHESSNQEFELDDDDIDRFQYDDERT